MYPNVCIYIYNIHIIRHKLCFIILPGIMIPIDSYIFQTKVALPSMADSLGSHKIREQHDLNRSPKKVGKPWGYHNFEDQIPTFGSHPAALWVSAAPHLPRANRVDAMGDLNRPLMEAAAALDLPVIQDLLKRGLVDPGPRKRGWKMLEAP